MQQDAEECWTNIMYCLRECLDGGGVGAEHAGGVAGANGASGSGGSGGSGGAAGRKRKLSEIFGIGLETTLASTETDEKTTESSECYALKCNITAAINYVQEGLKLALSEDREKRSAELGRDVLFRGSSAVSKLPEYLTVQMVRFFYKQDVKQKAKILRPVAFPLTLDAHELCTDALKARLTEPRRREQEASDAAAGLTAAVTDGKGKAKEEEGGAADGNGNGHGAGAGAGAAPAAAGDAEMADAGTAAGVPPELTGNYELVAVLTHKGRSADSGHYVAWVKNDKGKWVEFDDETPKPRKEEDIMTLKGGGDWHMAYMCLYRGKKA